MSATVSITQGPLPEAPRWQVAGAGAAVIFEGVVRPDEDGQPIAGLAYQAYQPLATTQLGALAEQAFGRQGILGVHVEHSEGFVPAGEVSFRLTIHAEHRKEALAVMDWYIDAMKRDVPIWKQARAHD